MRHNLKLCRLCAQNNNNMPTVPLFAKRSKVILRKICQLTGVMLKNIKTYPSVICLECEGELNSAVEFREKCIATQAYFTSVEYKATFNDYQENVGEYGESEKLENIFVKLEVIACGNENKKTDFNLETKSKSYLKHNIAGTVEASNGIIIPVNESEIINVYDDGEETEVLVAQAAEDVMHNKYVHDERKAHMEIELEKPIVQSERLGEAPEKKDGVNEEVLTDVNGLKLDPDKENSQDLNELSNKKKNGAGTSKPRIYICDQCGNNFKYRSHFYSHIKRHTGIKPLQCEVCPNKFFTEGELKRHMRRHTGERPFPCKHCQRRFTDYSTRIKHERTHTNERPFECPQCGKAFTTSYVLKNHMLVHTGERSFECTSCKKSFQRQTHLIVHFRSMAHKQNIKREQQLMQQKCEELENFPAKDT